MKIFLTEGPSITDPTDVSSIVVLHINPVTGLSQYIPLATVSWMARLGVYLVRRYVKKSIGW